MNDELLIESVRNCPWLFDKSNIDFKDREKKSRTWKEVAKNLGVEDTIAMKRWGTLRERFTKEIRSSRNTSGSGASVGKPWPLLETMQFLRGHVIPRQMRESAPMLTPTSNTEADVSVTSIDVLCEPYSPSLHFSSQSSTICTDQSTTTECAQSLPSTSRPRKRKAAQLDDLDTAILDTVKTFREVCARKARREELSPEINSFGSMLCSVISKMKKQHTKAVVMRHCTDFAMQAQIDELEEEE